MDRGDAWAWYDGLPDKVKGEALVRLRIIQRVDNLTAPMGWHLAVTGVAREQKVAPRSIWNWIEMIEGIDVADRLPYLRSATATASGQTGLIEVSPPIREGGVAGTAVQLIWPRAARRSWSPALPIPGKPKLNVRQDADPHRLHQLESHAAMGLLTRAPQGSLLDAGREARLDTDCHQESLGKIAEIDPIPFTPAGFRRMLHPMSKQPPAYQASQPQSGPTQTGPTQPKPPQLRPRFWETVPLKQMRPEEWEALCDGCGKCCLNKIEYEDTGEVDFTRIACRLLDGDTCQCSQYPIRHQFVPDCVSLTPKKLAQIAYWLPRTCSYRLLQEGKPLPEWHYLLTGDRNSIHAAGYSVRGWTIPENEVPEDDWDDYVIEEKP